MVMEGASLLTIYVTIFTFLLLNIFIYALTLRNDVSILPLSKRLTFRVSAYRRIICSRSVPNEKNILNTYSEQVFAFIYFGWFLV